MTSYTAGYRVGIGLRALAAAVWAQASARTEDRTDGPTNTGPTTTARPTPRPRRLRGTEVTPSPRPSPRPAPRPRRHPSRLDGVEGPVAAPPGKDHEPAPGDDGASMALIRRAQGGDAQAFGELYERYVDLVFRYIYYRVGDRSQAEDFTSEVFLRALRRIGSFTWTGRDIGAWFVTIARNIVLDHVKSSRYRMEVTTAELLDSDGVQEGPEDTVLDSITNTELLRCVRQLGAEQQECIVLRFLQGLSVAETAQIMGKNDGAIKALQHRAVRRLAGLLPDGLR